MKKLTTSEINFIDRYLENSGVEFLDIRYEMTDHVATALEEMEGDFYDNFTQYMLEHKKQLLEQNKKAKKWSILSAVSYFWKTFRKPSSLLLFISVFIVAYLFTATITDYYNLVYYTNWSLLAFSIPVFWVGRKNKKVSVLSSVVQLWGVFYSIYNLVSMTFASLDRELRIIPQRYCTAVILAVTAVLIVSIYQCRKQYVGKYI